MGWCYGRLPLVNCLFKDAQDDVMMMGFDYEGEKEEIPQDCPKEYSDFAQQCWDIPDKRPKRSTDNISVIASKTARNS